MEIKWLGHAAFLITSEGIRVITDPYEPGAYGGGISYGPIGAVSYTHLTLPTKA